MMEAESLEIYEYSDSPESRARLFEFYRVAYLGMRELLDPKRFEWQTFKNPLKPEGRSFLFLLRARGGEILGQNILLPYRLSIDQCSTDALCSTNLIVLPGLVGKGTGHLLIERHEQEGKLCFAVGITPASSRAFQKRGWRPVDDSRLHAAFLNPKPCLRFVKKTGIAASLAIPMLHLMNWAFKVGSKFAVPQSLPEVTVEPITRFSSDWDRIWSVCLRPYGIHFIRSADFLNWKFFSRHDVTHHARLVRFRGNPVGYIVYRLSRNEDRGICLGRIVDLVYLRDSVPKLAHFMIGMAKRELSRERVDGIVGVASSQDLKSAYIANGLFLTRPQPAIILESGFSVNDLRGKYENLWFISLADSDLDNYW